LVTGLQHFILYVCVLLPYIIHFSSSNGLFSYQMTARCRSYVDYMCTTWKLHYKMLKFKKSIATKISDASVAPTWMACTTDDVGKLSSIKVDWHLVVWWSYPVSWKSVSRFKVTLGGWHTWMWWYHKHVFSYKQGKYDEHGLEESWTIKCKNWAKPTSQIASKEIYVLAQKDTNEWMCLHSESYFWKLYD
jgi:hypothetical protein